MKDEDLGAKERIIADPQGWHHSHFMHRDLLGNSGMAARWNPSPEREAQMRDPG
jgi:hypothetical protein